MYENNIIHLINFRGTHKIKYVSNVYNNFIVLGKPL